MLLVFSCLISLVFLIIICCYFNSFAKATINLYYDSDDDLADDLILINSQAWKI